MMGEPGVVPPLVDNTLSCMRLAMCGDYDKATVSDIPVPFCQLSIRYRYTLPSVGSRGFYFASGIAQEVQADHEPRCRRSHPSSNLPSTWRLS